MKRSTPNQKLALSSLLCAVIVLCATTALASTNRVLSLDGNGDYLSVPSTASLQNPDEVTIEMWMFLARTAGHTGGAVLYKSDGADGDSQRTYELKWQTNGTLIFAVYFTLPVAANQPHFAEIFAPVAESTWTHVAATYSTNSGLKIYTNGFLASATTTYDGKSFIGLKLRQTSLPLYFGGNLIPEQSVSGAMDEIRIWNKARSLVEILGSYSCRLTGSESNLVAYWNFDSGTANDITGHGHNGTFAGNASAAILSGPDVIHAGCSPYLSIRVSQVELCWDSVPTNAYQLQYRSTLTTNQWANLGGVIVGDGSQQCVTDSIPQNQPQRFYRLTVTP